MSQQFDLSRVEAHFKQVLLYAPGMLGNDAVNFFLDRFQQQAWLGVTAEPWARRRTNLKRNSGRAILISSGRLRRSIRITSITNGQVTIGSDVPYARMHNEGFRGVVNVSAHSRNKYSKEKVGTGKLKKNGLERMRTVQRIAGTGGVIAHTRKVNMPRRQFMGSSPYLTKLLERRLTAELMKGLRIA